MKTALTVAILVLLLAAALLLLYYGWTIGGESVELGAHGIAALVIGAIGTMALGAGLMFLVFHSHRRGYDEAADRHGRDEHGRK